MNFETIKDRVSGYIKTQQEIRASKNLIEESEGRVSMIVFDHQDNSQGKPFGPIGYREDEIDAIKREIKTGKRIIVSGLDGSGVVTIVNRKNN